MKAMKLTFAALAAVGLLAGCAQGGDDTTGVGPGGPGGGGGGGGGNSGVENCSVPMSRSARMSARPPSPSSPPISS